MVMPATLSGRPAGNDCQTRDVVALRALLRGAAEHQILDLGAIDAGAPHRLAHRVPGKHRRLGIVERAAKRLADGRSRDRDNDRFTHGLLLRNKDD